MRYYHTCEVDGCKELSFYRSGYCEKHLLENIAARDEVKCIAKTCINIKENHSGYCDHCQAIFEHGREYSIERLKKEGRLKNGNNTN